MSASNAPIKESKNKEIFLSNSTIKRLLTDVKSLYQNPLSEHNIHYIHDDKDVLKGYALIIGPEETVYYGGAYLFEFNFPDNYPYSPPTLKFQTTDGVTRFNPNLYKNGKVCVSILNTWQGEEWSSCQTISSVLLTLVSLLNNKPLLNEPGITEKHPEFNKYTRSIHYKNIDIAIIGFLNIDNWSLNFKQFYEIYLEYFHKHKDTINDIIVQFKDKGEPEKVHISLYYMNTEINYANLYEKFNKAIEVINN